MLSFHQLGLYPRSELLVVLNILAVDQLRQRRLDLLVDSQEMFFIG